ncbi:MAG: hypothetical protein AB9888_03570 [Bacteroidales bacterium]
MKTTFSFFFLLGLMVFIPGLNTSGQVSINTTGEPPDNSAMLDIKSTGKGLLIPRMTQSQIEAIDDPADGLLVYNLTTGKVYLFVATERQWSEVAFGGSTISPPAFTCGSHITVNHTVAGGVAPVDKYVVYGTVGNIPGETSKCWITSNLGSDHQAVSFTDPSEASAGWYWQFNRKQGFKHDGTTRTPGTAWISFINENLDWASANDPCLIELGTGWRIPTSTEWYNVETGGGWSTYTAAWNSGLKLHAAGYMWWSNNGQLMSRGSYGDYWSSTQNYSSPELGWHMLIHNNSDPGGNPNWYKAHGFSVRCISGTPSSGLPSITTNVTTEITGTTATSGGNITSEGVAPVYERGVCWSTSANPRTTGSHTSDGSGGGTFTSSITGLTDNTLYYVRAYASSAVGTTYGNQESFTASSAWACGSTLIINHVAGDVAPVSKTVTYGTVSGVPGEPSKCWITSNLGSDHQATAVNDATEASAGWYWQFNRKQGYKHDGTTRTPNTTWISAIDENFDWSADTDPCYLELGTGWRLPTYTEWFNVDESGSWTSQSGPWTSVLKLHDAGHLVESNGSIVERGIVGLYWSSSQIPTTTGSLMYFTSASSEMDYTNKANGLPIRCIKD